MAGGGGADSGQAANAGGGGWSGWLDGFWSGADAGALGGGGVVASPEATTRWTETIKERAADTMLGKYPGYGSLWTFGPGGVAVTMAGKLAAAGLVLGIVLLMGRR